MSFKLSSGSYDKSSLHFLQHSALQSINDDDSNFFCNKISPKIKHQVDHKVSKNIALSCTTCILFPHSFPKTSQNISMFCACKRGACAKSTQAARVHPRSAISRHASSQLAASARSNAESGGCRQRRNRLLGRNWEHKAMHTKRYYKVAG